LPMSLAGADEERATAGARDLLDVFEVDIVANKLPEELSGGQSERVGIARAFSGSPRLVLADEPTGQQDRSTGGRLLEAIVTLAVLGGAALVAATRGVTAELPVGYADTSGLSSRNAGTVQTTGPGVVLGLPPDYATTFPGEIRPLVGATTGVLLAQQTAANLGASVGSTITIGRPGQSKTTVTVDGVVDLPAADSLFQSIGVAPGSAPTAPPDNVVLLP